MGHFEIYRSKQNDCHFVAIRSDDNHENAQGVRESPNLIPHTAIPDDGQSRIAFDAKEAIRRIERDGFYAFNVRVEVREHID